MKKYTKEEVLHQFEVSCDIIYKASDTGDYKTGNKEYKKLIRIFKYFEKNKEFASECLRELLYNDNFVINTKVAAYCLALNENVNEAVKILLANSKKKENGIFRFEAEMTLRVWKTEGYLSVYQGQEIRRNGPGVGTLFDKTLLDDLENMV